MVTWIYYGELALFGLAVGAAIGVVMLPAGLLLTVGGVRFLNWMQARWPAWLSL